MERPRPFRLTDGERDRRWSTARDEMRALGIHAVVCTPSLDPSAAFQPDSLYLSGVGAEVGGVACILPVEEPPILIAAELADAAIEQGAAHTRAGATDLEVWGGAIGELCRAGSSLPVQSTWGSGLRPTIFNRPTFGPLQLGSLVVARIEAERSAYRT